MYGIQTMVNDQKSELAIVMNDIQLIRDALTSHVAKEDVVYEIFKRVMNIGVSITGAPADVRVAQTTTTVRLEMPDLLPQLPGAGNSSRRVHQSERVHSLSQLPNPLCRQADHFRRYPGDRAGPPAPEIRKTLEHIDFTRICISEIEIRIKLRMALTLNGIAQGYITDRVGELLRARGWPDVLINLGEMRATGVSPVGSPWTAVLASPLHSRANPSLPTVSERALATSAGRATVFEASGHHHHLSSPWDGRSAGEFHSVSVAAFHATVADALSTALYVMPRDRMPRLIKSFPAVEAQRIDANGSIAHLT